MVQLVDAIMISCAIRGEYIPKEDRKRYKVIIRESEEFSIEIITDCSETAKNIADQLFEGHRTLFTKEGCMTTLATIDLQEQSKQKSKERIRQSFSRFDPHF